jgi:cytochrome P450 family 6
MLDTFEYRESSQIERKDFISLLLGLKDSFTKTELAAEGSLLFAAGYENSSTVIAFTLYELALQPHIQNRLRDEIRKKVDENEGKMTYELMQEMKYLDMVVSENLRKNPPVSDNARTCTKDFIVPGTDGFVIKEGEVIEFNLLSFHRDEEYFPDPMRFDPERFSEANLIKPFTYLPFGAGPR